jgi:hypothetical protein
MRTQEKEQVRQQEQQEQHEQQVPGAELSRGLSLALFLSVVAGFVLLLAFGWSWSLPAQMGIGMGPALLVVSAALIARRRPR